MASDPASSTFAYRKVLIVGASSGIGWALASSLHGLPNKPHILVAARRMDRLESLRKELGHERVSSIQLDLQWDDVKLKEWVENVLREHRDLDGIILNSGIQHKWDFSKPLGIDMSVIKVEFQVNYLSFISLLAAFLPHFQTLPIPSLIATVTSGLAIEPTPAVFNYCASKAALHSLTVSLRADLKALGHTSIRVVEIFPPLVESELHDHQGTVPVLSKFWMPLQEFNDILVKRLTETDEEEIPIGARVEDAWQRREKGKMESVQAVARRMRGGA
ncbi:NAD(P)-binding protein [Atractiella rhizophila]|nr:NAD(P)-binding protein [Atractiella rhizophila]